ncbi:organic cation transporter protein isoform X3 [Bombyx mandarina]|uniref:Organic cation transporter protein isoform X1 n=1 Tax=Bombyx mandarina TaxID=7092 RepID=A0A6J2K6N0_BOMMA|nr:organic cation transporter protein isoform X1 [Bombyx mandarina]XP_028037274.1 organic cation transporter protein isoform X2 [Bombyx mandarina]XP_028037276.1 organic cation transporter protein isoform X3 [Bombyx mandarina]
MDKDRALEEMMGKLGDFGRYQCFQFILHILAAMTAGMHMLSLVTVAAVPDHRCWIDGVDTNESIAAWNSSEILAAVPKTSSGSLHNCLMYQDNDTITCTKWVFDTTYRSSSHAIEWNLVCEQRWLGSIVQTVYMLGVFTGAVTLGTMADKYGRKTIFCWSGVLQLIFGVAVAFIPEYWTFLVIRFLYGVFGSAGSYITGFVLTMELVGPSKRTSCGVAFQAAFAAGIMLVAGWGALIDNRQILQMIYGLHSLLLIPHIWIMDESPRWLWAQGRVKESVDIVEKALKCNNSENIDKAHFVSRGKVESCKGSEAATTAGTTDLFKTPNLRIKTLNVCFCWFANSIAYYGLTLSSGKLEGNPYLITAIMGFVEFPSYGAVIYFLDIWGRRPLISSMMLVGGIACVVATFLPAGSIISTAIVIAGKLFIAGSFAIIYNYSAELFPTVVRNSALGLGSMCARFSGALTPLITLLDSFNPKIPAVTFGALAVISGLLCFFLPETMNQPMPQSLTDGEEFGKGDTIFASCFGKEKNRKYDDKADDKAAESMVPLEDVSKKV